MIYSTDAISTRSPNGDQDTDWEDQDHPTDLKSRTERLSADNGGLENIDEDPSSDNTRMASRFKYEGYSGPFQENKPREEFELNGEHYNSLKSNQSIPTDDTNLSL